MDARVLANLHHPQADRVPGGECAIHKGSHMESILLIPETANVHVVDDDDSFRQSIIRVLSAAGLQAHGYRCAGEFLLATLDDCPSCLLLDISMPGPSGVDLLKALVSKNLGPPIIFVTAHDEIVMSVAAIKSGAIDYLVKPVRAETLLPAVLKAIALDAQQRDARRQLNELRERVNTLTDAEQVVFRGIVRNKLNKQLAAELGTCERTIKAHRARMMNKLHARTVPDLVRAAKLLDDNSRENQKRIGVMDQHAQTASTPPVPSITPRRDLWRAVTERAEPAP